MKITLSLILLVLALVCFVCAAFGVMARVSWRDLGYAFAVAAVIAGRW